MNAKPCRVCTSAVYDSALRLLSHPLCIAKRETTPGVMAFYDVGLCFKVPGQGFFDIGLVHLRPTSDTTKPLVYVDNEAYLDALLLASTCGINLENERYRKKYHTMASWFIRVDHIEGNILR